MRWSSRRRFIGILAVVCACSAAGRADAASKALPVQAKAIKPLSLTSVQDLDLGTMVLGPGSWSGATVGITRAGVFSCTNSNVTCTGATRVASYTLTGSNNEVVRITVPTVVLKNASDPTQTLTLVADSPGTVTLDTGGKKGTDFSIGGTVSLSSTTAGGLYTGTFNVTVDY